MNEELKNEIDALFEKHYVKSGFRLGVLTMKFDGGKGTTYYIVDKNSESVLTDRLSMYANLLESADHIKDNLIESIRSSNFDDENRKLALELIESSINKIHEMRNKMNQTDNTSIH